MAIDIKDVRERNRFAIMNTATGRHLDAALTELETLQTVLDVLPRLWQEGHVTKEQDGEWWLFDSRGEGVVGGGSFHELCINISGR